MKKPRLGQDYLQDILDAIDKTEEFIGSKDFQAFRNDDKTVFAVIRCLEIIGEAAKKIPIPPAASIWGNSLEKFNGNAGVSLDIVWQTVKEDIPPLRQELANILECVRAEENKQP